MSLIRRAYPSDVSDDFASRRRGRRSTSRRNAGCRPDASRNGPRTCARAVPGGRAQGRTVSRHPRRPNAACDTREQRAGRRRWGQAQAGLEAADGGGHARSFPGPACHAGQRADDRAQVEHLAKAVQAATDDSVEIAFVDQGHAGQKPATAARMEGESIPEIFPSTAAHRGLEAPARYDQAGFATRRVQSRDSRSRPSRPQCRLSAGPRLAQGPARSSRFPHESGTTGTSP